VIVGKSDFILNLKKTLEKISLSNARTLISGPIGSGKKLIAQTIHKISKRSNLLANIIDFSTISSEQLNELFNNDISYLPEGICNLNIQWSDMDNAYYPYFAIGGNNLCENIPDCIANSENFHISLDQWYYTWPVSDSQNCDGLYNLNEFINPIDFKLVQPYPNPFNPETVITFEVSQKTYLQLEVFNLIGKKITTLQKGYFEPGLHKTIWNGQNYPSGVYLIRMKTGDYSQLRKVILMK